MKKVLITGGSRGIGRACVEYFSEKGWRVFFTYEKNADAAEYVSEKTGACAIRCDVSDSNALDSVKAEIDKFGGRLDCIVNNAGIASQKLFTDITEQEWDRMFDVNVKGMFLTVKKFVPAMIAEHSGSIINISSIWGLGGGSCEVHYAASKAAVIGFTRALADELGPSGIRVNCVAPGVIDTDMNSHLDCDAIEELKNETPLCCTGKPRQVAETVYYLAENAGFITGEVIKVSGGF